MLPVFMLLASIILTGWLGFHPHMAKPVIAIFAPGTSFNSAMSASVKAGGLIVGYGVTRNSIVVQADDTDFFQRLYQAGAWLVVDAQGSGLCKRRTGSQIKDRN